LLVVMPRCATTRAPLHRLGIECSRNVIGCPLRYLVFTRDPAADGAGIDPEPPR
jgi:hypothetical protein